MAIYTQPDKELVCPICKGNLFVEKQVVHFDKEPGRIRDIILKTNSSKLVQCANPDCNHVIDVDTSEFFKNSQVILKE